MWPIGQSTVDRDVLRGASARARPPTKELFLIILMHMTNRVNPGPVRGFNGVLYNL